MFMYVFYKSVVAGLGVRISGSFVQVYLHIFSAGSRRSMYVYMYKKENKMYMFTYTKKEQNAYVYVCKI